VNLVGAGDPAPGAHAAAVPAIEVLSAEKTYPDGTHALQPVELSIPEGEFVTLLGPSGCGKSTLLKMVAGLLEPSDGRLLLWRRPVRELEATGRRIAFVFQAATLMPWASVETNVRLPLDLAGVPRAEARARVADALALVGLAKFGQALPRALSGGMQMRVSIARALVVDPQLLLMDEPFGALDEITRGKLDADLLELWRSKGLTVLFVTHSIHEAVFLSNRVVMMAARPGRVIEEIAIDEPHPRTPDFMVSPAFNRYAKRLQDSLLRASSEAEIDAPPVRVRA
jgi:NitT/TauT family transport system ATP-binding protein